MAQGFVKNLNLVESRTEGSDRAILDNLGGANITTDVLLFDGNSNSTSKLINDTSQDPDLVQFSLYIDEDGDQRIQVTRGGNLGSFSNGTKLVMTNTATGADLGTFFVFASDGSSNFQLETVKGSGTATVFDAVTISNATLTRSDTITIDAMTNLAAEQPVTNDIASEQDGAVAGDTGVDFGEEGGADAGGLGAEASPPDVLNEFTTFSQTAYIMRIVGGIKYKKTRIPLTYQDSLFDETIRIRGDARVINTSQLEIGYPKAVTSGPLVLNKVYEIIDKGTTPDSYFDSVSGQDITWSNGTTFRVVDDTITGTGNGTVKPTSPPGLYIYNTSSGDEIRAFSGSDNPWAEASNVSILGGVDVLKTLSDKSQVNKLYFHPTSSTAVPEISKLNTSHNVHQDWVLSQSNSVSSYTHKLPVIVNGEQFYFLLKT
jgi:hypothetical protein